MNIINKTHKDSWFTKFHIDSPFAKNVFGKNSNKIILQIMPLDDEIVIAELVNKTDYERSR